MIRKLNIIRMLSAACGPGLVLAGVLFTAPRVGALTTMDLMSWQYPTDQELSDLAVEHGLIKPDLRDRYKANDTATNWKLWIIRSREEKRLLIKQMKDVFAEADNAVIQKPDEHYVNEINIRIQNVLKEGDIDYFNKVTVPTLFKSLAIIEGDYNDGRTQPLQLIRNWFGETGVEQMKARFPERYEQLKQQELDAALQPRP
ncbi:MAG: hypothetical protein KC897_01500 [Candidatus Omnitrophica bacterium]|nr:hypothetical protein [Candidatus Omnitrophota bacterium]MCB9720211.1 hypothetical protein [Candidatus Omnitrophota bacterium]